MTESPTPSKFAKWKRPLVGGLLSAGIAGISLFILMLLFGSPSAAGLLAWPLAVRMLFFRPRNEFTEIVIALLIWFLIGFMIAHFIKSNKQAILFWFLPLTLSFLPLLFGWYYVNFLFN